MIYSMNYYENSKYKDEVSEYRIRFSKDSLVSQLVKFIKGHPDKRIFVAVEDIFDFNEKEIFKKFTSLIDKETNNYTFCFCGDLRPYMIREIERKAKENNIPFCFEKTIYDIDSLYGMLSIGVSDVYISGKLGFNMAAVKLAAEAYNVKVRCYPDVCQSPWFGFEPLFSFWIRPEDIDLYEPYIDVLEFWKDRDDVTIADLMFNVYAKEKKWKGDLSYIVTGLNKLENECIINAFGRSRVNCGKKCFLNSNCDICRQITELSKKFYENNIVLKDK